MQRKILFVSAGMLREKNDYKIYQTENLYLNYGLLGLATNLHAQGYEVIVYQADRKAPQALFDEILSTTEIDRRYPLFLSIPSFYSISWAEDFTEIVKGACAMRIVAGGRWVVDRNLTWIKSRLPLVDFFVKGCPDDTIQKYLFSEKWSELSAPQCYRAPFRVLEYPLLYQFQKYPPIIEVARGCGGGCSFCLESHYPYCPPKRPVEILEEAETICKVYRKQDLNFYFEGSVFLPTASWARAFAEEYQRRRMRFHFRMQSRADMLLPEAVSILSTAGLKVLDIGLESASHQQLISMGKTKDPAQYLKKAEVLLRTAREHGVWCKLNLLLYAGETADTVEETRSWLQERRSYFEGISCNPLTVFLDGEHTKDYIQSLERISNTKIDREKLLQKGYCTFALSPTMDQGKVRKTVNALYDEFMTPEAYSALKAVSYTPLEDYE